MGQSSSSLTASLILQAFADSNRRDELLACLDFIGRAQQANQDLLLSQTLASFPAWLEEQGFSAQLLGSFFHDVDRIATPDSSSEPLAEIYTSLGPEASVLQLVNVVAERSPIVYEIIDQTLEEAHHLAQELGAVGGGMSKNEKIEVGVGAVFVAGGIGLLVRAIRGGQDPVQARRLQELFNDNHAVADDALAGGLNAIDNENLVAARNLVQQEADHVNQRIERAENAVARSIEIDVQDLLVAKRANLDPQLAAEHVNHLADDPNLGSDAYADGVSDVQQLEQNNLSRVSSGFPVTEISGFNESFSARIDEEVDEVVERELQDAEREIVDLARLDAEEVVVRAAETEADVWGMDKRWAEEVDKYIRSAGP